MEMGRVLKCMLVGGVCMSRKIVCVFIVAGWGGGGRGGRRVEC